MHSFCNTETTLLLVSVIMVYDNQSPGSPLPAFQDHCSVLTGRAQLPRVAALYPRSTET